VAHQKVLGEKVFIRTLKELIKKIVVDEFHKVYYNVPRRTWSKTFWLNCPAQKCPLDLWVYQEIICEVQPDIIVESGTADGGSALFLASVCDLMNRGQVITIDIEDNLARPRHQRITYLLGSSTSDEIVKVVGSAIAGKEKVMVILDSDHHKEHVCNELKIYSTFVTKGSYCIVEDTNIHGHPVRKDFPAGPMEAVDEFLRGNKDFVIDTSREKFFLTFAPNGYLKKIG